MNINDVFIEKHNLLTAATKGAAPGVQIMWVAAAMTAFQFLIDWAAKHER